mgnify:CR=1 FL=1
MLMKHILDVIALTIKDKVVTAVERNKGSRKDRSISLRNLCN